MLTASSDTCELCELNIKATQNIFVRVDFPNMSNMGEWVPEKHESYEIYCAYLKLYRTRSKHFSNSCLMSINTDNYENRKNKKELYRNLR